MPNLSHTAQEGKGTISTGTFPLVALCPADKSHWLEPIPTDAWSRHAYELSVASGAESSWALLTGVVVITAYVAPTVQEGNVQILCTLMDSDKPQHLLLVVSILFITHYILIDHLASCSLWFRAYTWIGMLSIAIIESESRCPLSKIILMHFPALLLVRTWALWGRSRTMLIWLSVLLFVSECLPHNYAACLTTKFRFVYCLQWGRLYISCSLLPASVNIFLSLYDCVLIPLFRYSFDQQHLTLPECGPQDRCS